MVLDTKVPLTKSDGWGSFFSSFNKIVCKMLRCGSGPESNAITLYFFCCTLAVLRRESMPMNLVLGNGGCESAPAALGVVAASGTQHSLKLEISMWLNLLAAFASNVRLNGACRCSWCVMKMLLMCLW